MKNYAYLLFVDEVSNHNKFYEIIQNDDDSIDVNYGRVGNQVTMHHYEAWEKNFFTLKSLKESKGYTDVTALHSVKSNTTNQKKNDELSYKPIEDSKINELVVELINSAREFIKHNYTISSTDITQKMIDEADNDLNELMTIANNANSNASLWRFNEKLKELFIDIPRRMGNVKDYLAVTSKDFTRIIEREKDMLDNIRGQVVAVKEDKVHTEKDITVTEAYGVNISNTTFDEEDQILSHLGKDYNGLDVDRRYITSYKVENLNTRKEYEEFKAANHISRRDCKLFYHGSKVENWWSIMKTGLSLNPDARVTGKMFGAGLYFANECRKSLNYMDTKSSCWNNGTRSSGFIAIYSVALGKCYEPTDCLPNSFNKNNLPHGCLSVYADKNKTGLRNDEYIIYDQRQCTIKYLVEMKDYDCRNKEYNLDRKQMSNAFKYSLSPIERSYYGVSAELFIDKLPQKAKEEFINKIACGAEYNHWYIDYDIQNDKISFIGQNANDDIKVHYNYSLTTDDLAFLAREFRKAFAVSEKEWNNLANNCKNEPEGKLICSPINEKNNTDKSKHNHEKEKEL